MTHPPPWCVLFGLGLSIPLASAQAPPGTVLHVKTDAGGLNNGSSWTDAYTSLQDALTAAAASGGAVTEIHVSAGIHRPDRGANQNSWNRNATFQMSNGMAVRGGYAGTDGDPDARDLVAHPTVLSGDLASNDSPGFANNAENAYHVVFCGAAVGPSATLDGVTILAGNANGTGTASNGGGLYCDSGSRTLLLGLSNMELVFRYKGRPERPTLNEGNPCLKILA